MQTSGRHVLVLSAALAWGGCGDDGAQPAGGGGAGTGGEASGAGGEGGGVDPCGGMVTTEEPRFAQAMSALRGTIDGQAIAGGAIAVIQDGQILGLGVAGTKRAGVCEPVTADTLFGAGYGSEILTAIAVLDLEEEGLVALDDALTTHVTVTAEVGDPSEIQLQHLLTNSSMFTSAADGPDITTICGPLAEYFASPVDAIIQTTPGTMHNAEHRGNFELAGLVLEEVEGAAFPEAIAARVLGPLGMGGGYILSELSEGDLAFGFGESTQNDCRQRDPSLGYYGSIRDLSRLAQYIMVDDGAVLDPGNHSAMRANVRPAFFGSDYVGHALPGSVNPNGYAVWYAFGQSAGFGHATFWFRRPSCSAGEPCELAVVVVVNDGFAPVDLALEIAQVYEEGANFDFPVHVPDPVAVASLAGDYVDAIEGRALSIEVDPEDPLQLRAELPTGELLWLLSQHSPPVEDTYRFGPGANNVARFWRDENGEPYGLQTIDDGPPFMRVVP